MGAMGCRDSARGAGRYVTLCSPHKNRQIREDRSGIQREVAQATAREREKREKETINGLRTSPNARNHGNGKEKRQSREDKFTSEIGTYETQ